MKQLLKITKLQKGFLAENGSGYQFAYASLQEIAKEITMMLKSAKSDKLSVTVETEETRKGKK